MGKPDFTRVAAFFPLCEAAYRASRGNIRSQQAAAFMLNLEHEVLSLEGELLNRSYRPRPYCQFSIADPKPRVISEEGFWVINIPRIKMEVVAKSPRIYSAELQLELSIVLWEQANISDELEEKAERVCDVFSKDRFFGGLVGDSVLGEVRFRFDDSSERVLGVCEIEYLLRYDEMQVS